MPIFAYMILVPASANPFDPRFSEVAFGLTAEAYSEPFETGFGYQIVKVLEGPETTKKPLVAVEGQIRQKLRAAAKVAEETRLREMVPVKVSRGAWTPSQMANAPANRPVPTAPSDAAAQT